MPERGGGRIPTTILFTDIVDSTVKATELGDERWREILRAHHATIRRELKRYGGHEVDNAGDGFFAAFTGPADAIRCACAIVDAVKPLGIEVRAGVHVGESVRVGDKPGGVAVHIGSRIAGNAGPSEVAVSGTVRDLTEGSGIDFEDRGVKALKGVKGEWRIYAVLRKGDLAPKELVPERPTEKRRARPRWAIPAVAGVVLAAIVAGVLVLRSDGPPPGGPASPVTTSPPEVTLARVDEDGLAPMTAGALAGHVALDGDVLWVSTITGGDRVERWDAVDDRLVSRIDLGPRSPFRPPSVAAAFGRVWVLRYPVTSDGVAGALDGEIVEIDRTSHEIARRIKLGFAPNRALAAGGGAVWTAAPDGRVLRIDPESGEVRTVFTVDGSVSALAWGDGSLYGVEPDLGLFRYRPGTASRPTFRTVDEPLALALGAGSVWVTSSEEGTGGDPDTASLVRLDDRTLEQQTVLVVPDRPVAVAATDDQVWVGSLTGSIVGFGADERTLREPITVPGPLRSIALTAGDAGVFVAILPLVF